MHGAMKVRFRFILYLYRQHEGVKNQILMVFNVDKEEAAVTFVEVPTRTVKPTQSCSGCGQQRPKPLSERIHQCPNCQLRLPRDHNASRCMLNWVLFGQTWSPTDLISGLERAEVRRS